MATAARRAKKTFTYRGKDLDTLLDLDKEELFKLFPSRARRKLNRGIDKKSYNFIKKLRKAKKAAPEGEYPEPVRTHLRNLIVVPEMIGSIVSCHNGREFMPFEVKAEMIGHYLGEFAITYKPVRHGKPGIGATSSSKFVPLK